MSVIILAACDTCESGLMHDGQLPELVEPDFAGQFELVLSIEGWHLTPQGALSVRQVRN